MTQIRWKILIIAGFIIPSIACAEDTGSPIHIDGDRFPARSNETLQIKCPAGQFTASVTNTYDVAPTLVLTRPDGRPPSQNESRKIAEQIGDYTVVDLSSPGCRNPGGLILAVTAKRHGDRVNSSDDIRKFRVIWANDNTITISNIRVIPPEAQY